MTDFRVFWNEGQGSTLTIKTASNGLSPTTATFSGGDIQADKDYIFAITALNAVGYSALS